MPMKLYASPDDYKTQKALIAAKYVGLAIELPKGKAEAETGKIPVLETDRGCIFSSSAIARYISRISRPVALYGHSILDGGMIDSWIEFSTNELEVPLSTWILIAKGVFEDSPEYMACAKEDVRRALAVLNNHLLCNTFMVGHTITLADISLCCALAEGMRLVFDPEYRKEFGNLMRWFNLCMAQPEFSGVLGEVKLCSKAAAAAPPAAKAAPAPKAEAKKEAAPKEAKPKQEPKGKEAKPKAEPKAKSEPKAKAKAEPKAKAKAEPEKPKEVDPVKERAALLKKVKKEGGKRGVEIEGAADMGGLQFFCTSVDLPDGDLDLLLESMNAMNEKSDPTEEERKGGSGHIGKMIFSAGTEQLAVVAYVPEEKQGELSCEEWLKTVLDLFSGEVLSTAKDLCTGVVKTNSDKGVFPLKVREPMLLEANNFLRKKGLFPEDDGDDDDYVFGDDDFPA